MSVHAGTILHVGANNVIDRIQSAGLGDVRNPQETIREVGNTAIVDKIPGDPDYTFTLESLDVTTELEAMLTGGWGGQASGAALDAAAPDGTAYHFEDFDVVNIVSPWKDPTSGSAGVVDAGHIVPGYYVNRINYRFGATDNSQQTVELGGGSYYYSDHAPVEEHFTAGASQAAYVSANASVPYRKGGAEGTSFRRAFGVTVDGVLQTYGVDYTDGPDSNAETVVTVTFEATKVPATGASVKFCYFTTADVSWPDTRHASIVTKPAAVRGRHVAVYIRPSRGARAGVRSRMGYVQAATLEASFDGTLEREMDNEEVVGRTINGTDCTGDVTVRSRDKDAFFDLLEDITGVSKAEVFGFLNTNAVELEIVIRNPKNPAQTLKTLYVSDAVFQVPGTPARVNTPTDFVFRWESSSGRYTTYKGAKP